MMTWLDIGSIPDLLSGRKNMKRSYWIAGIVLVLIVAGYFAYRALTAQRVSAAASVQTATVQRGTLTSSLSSAGTVRTGQSAVITWQTSGKVGEVNVKLGDHVSAGQVLAALDSSALSPSTINARQNLIAAKKNLDDLLNSKLQQAQALQAVSDAQAALDQLKETHAKDTGQAQVDLAAAQKAVDDAQKKRNALNYPHSTDQLVIQKAETDYLLAKADYKEALQKFNLYAKKNLTNPDRVAALNALVAAKQKMDQAFAKYNWYLQMPTANEIAQADANLALAQANLAAAQSAYDNLKNGPNAAEIAVAEARLADAQRAWERVKDGPNPDDIAAAQAAVDAAQATLNQIQLTAPISGTITELDIASGDMVSSGTQAFRIDDFSAIYVDLEVSEIDINNLQPGQPATLTFDAIPDKQYTGVVTRIGTVGTVSQGVVNYPVTVQITNPDEAVKPGMTAAASVVIAQHEDVLMVPNQAIRVAGNQRTVTVLFEGQQIPVQVSIGLTNETMSEVIGNQLKEGDEVVLNPSTAASNSNRLFGGQGGGAIFVGRP
jgi:HlyD family secretion protein